jgi:hypothetical protein
MYADEFSKTNVDTQLERYSSASSLTATEISTLGK